MYSNFKVSQPLRFSRSLTALWELIRLISASVIHRYTGYRVLTFPTVRQPLLFDLKWSICHAIQRLLRKIDYTGNFFKPVAGLISGTRVHMMTMGRFVVSVLRSSSPAVLSMSVIQSIEPTSRHVKKRLCIPGHHIRVLCVYFGFLFPFG